MFFAGRLRKVWRLFMCSFASLALSSSLVPAYAQSVNKESQSTAKASTSAIADTAHERVLHFPAQSIGALEIFPAGYVPEDVRMEPTRVVFPQSRLAASGTVKIAAGQFVHFRPSAKFFADPTVLNAIPPDGIDKIDMQFIPMFDEDDGLFPKAMTSVLRLTGLRFLNLNRSDATDKDVSRITCLKELLGVSAFAVPLDGSCIKELATLPKLKGLRIGNTTLNKDYLKYLPKFPKLVWLSLDGLMLHDQDIEYVSQCTQLTSLSLNRDMVTDACIPLLAKLTNLTMLDLRNTYVTDAGALKLRHLKLKILGLPATGLGRAQAQALTGAFPATRLILEKRGSIKNEDYTTIFAPITRH
jgi:hypothetical protein